MISIVRRPAADRLARRCCGLAVALTAALLGTAAPVVAAEPQPVRDNQQLARLNPQQPLVADRIIVRKADRRLELISDGKVVRSYLVSLGRDPQGAKRQQGDGRTPEGIYHVDWRKDDSRFYKALHVSYPNEDDRARAAGEGVHPGGMIMIHGAPNDPRTGDYGLKFDWTEGCIAVSNEAMDEIWAAVPDGAQVKILP